MRFSQSDINPGLFSAAVLNLGPQRVFTSEAGGDLLVVMMVKERPGYYVALGDNTYVPLLVKFNGPDADNRFDVVTIGSGPDSQRYTLDNPRLVPLDELAQRLAEHAIGRQSDPDAMSQSAVDLWFNAGLIAPETAMQQALDLARRHGWQNEWDLDDCGTLDTERLRDFVRVIVSGVARKMKRDYGFAHSTT